ncbi:MAG: hypothetical protein AAGA77_24945 [Bacteroidota bacterium]
MNTLIKFSLLSCVAVLIHTASYCQNVGIGTPMPSEKLEVSGIMYTNSGGVRFPDGTLQTTAAQSGNEVDASKVRAVGFLTIDGITGPLDTLGLLGTFPVYKAFQSNSFPVGADFGDLEVVTDFGTSSVELMQYVTQGVIFSHASFFLAEYNSMGTPIIYQQIGLGFARITMGDFDLQHKVGNEFSHLIRLNITSRYVGWQEQIGGNCFCWDTQNNVSASCSNCID